MTFKKQCSYSGCSVVLGDSRTKRSFCNEHRLRRMEENYDRAKKKYRAKISARKGNCEICGTKLKLGERKYCERNCRSKSIVKRYGLTALKLKHKRALRGLKIYQRRLIETTNTLNAKLNTFK